MKSPGAASAALLLAVLPRVTAGQAGERVETRSAGQAEEEALAARWRMPPMEMAMPMLPGLRDLVPDVSPFLPGLGADLTELPEARPPSVVRLTDGDTLDLEAALLRRTLGDRAVKLYGFNGEQPGPLIRVRRGATIVVRFRNRIELPITLRWHGVRLENRYDGVPGLTQKPVSPGESFVYRVRFDDPGLFWYHPHQHGEIAQDLGLYGNILVEPDRTDYYAPVNREAFLLLDDLQVDEKGLLPYGFEAPNNALMGRFGNLRLVNGEPAYSLEVHRGEVVRFYVTNASNTRTFNLSMGQAPMKLVAADLSKYEREVRVPNVPVAPGQRYVIDVHFPTPGRVAITSHIQAMNHFAGVFEPRVDTLGAVVVDEKAVQEEYAEEFEELRENEDVRADVEGLRDSFDRPVDRELVLSARVGALPTVVLAVMAMDTLYYPPIEWNDAMPMMNWLSTGREVRWIVHEPVAGGGTAELRPAVGWRFRQHDIVKLRIRNPARGFHPMQHPIHLHGQRFLVLERDGVRQSNFVWRDTVLLPVGATVDLLVEMSNPGRWMLNCQIPEHLGSGMAITFTVLPSPAR
ncbi:MAG: multicopper oxidase family protein [Gemmatimonadota bacterium]